MFVCLRRDPEQQVEALNAAPGVAPAPQVVDQLAEDVRVEFEAFLFEYGAFVCGGLAFPLLVVLPSVTVFHTSGLMIGCAVLPCYRATVLPCCRDVCDAGVSCVSSNGVGVRG